MSSCTLKGPCRWDLVKAPEVEVALGFRGGGLASSRDRGRGWESQRWVDPALLVVRMEEGPRARDVGSLEAGKGKSQISLGPQGDQTCPHLGLALGDASLRRQLEANTGFLWATLTQERELSVDSGHWTSL